MVNRPVLSPLHNTLSAGTVTDGVGFTVRMNACGKPAQPFARGITVMVPVTGAVVLFVTLNEGMLPVPEVPRPISALLLVQSKVVFATGPVKFRSPVALPLHNSRLAGKTTSGVGFTVMVKVCTTPVQLPVLGVTVMVAINCSCVGLVTVKL